MIIPDRKKAAAMILAKLHQPEAKMSSGGEVKPEAATSEHDQHLMAVCEDIMGAFHNKSAHGLMQGLKAFHAGYKELDNEKPEVE